MSREGPGGGPGGVLGRLAEPADELAGEVLGGRQRGGAAVEAELPAVQLHELAEDGVQLSRRDRPRRGAVIGAGHGGDHGPFGMILEVFDRDQPRVEAVFQVVDRVRHVVGPVHDLSLQAAAAAGGVGANPAEHGSVGGVGAVLGGQVQGDVGGAAGERGAASRPSASRPSGPGPSGATQGYLSAASKVARVRFRPAPGTFGSRRVSRRSDWALPSKPPQASAPPSSARAARADSPLWPNGGWPRSCARPAASTRSGSQPSTAPRSRPICAHSSEWVSRVLGKSADPARSTCVFAASLRRAELCRTRARSRWNCVRSARLGGSATQRSVSCAVYVTSPVCPPGPTVRARDRPVSANC